MGIDKQGGLRFLPEGSWPCHLSNLVGQGPHSSSSIPVRRKTMLLLGWLGQVPYCQAGPQQVEGGAPLRRGPQGQMGG